MAEPVEDDVSLLGSQETTEHNLEHTSEYQGPAKEYRSALRPPPLTPQPRQERKHMTAGRVLGGSVSPYSSTSPATSPRTPEPSPNYNIDASGSTYALQVALRNMKDRYHKLQRKVSLLEDDNQRLITGKSELFGEIGKLQNLQLNQEIHSKHQECCNLKEKFTTLSTENMNLNRQLARSTQDNRRLSKQVNVLNEENKKLKEKLSLIATQVKALPGGAGLAASASELTTASRRKISSASDDLDSFEDLTARFHPSYRDNMLDGYEECGTFLLGMCQQVSSTELGNSASLWSSNHTEEEKMLQNATRRMKELLSCLQDQNHSLLLLSPIIHSLPHSSSSRRVSSEPSKDGTMLSQRDRDLSTLTLTPSTHSQVDDTALQKVQDDEGTCQSRLATYGSVLPSSFVSGTGSNGSTRLERLDGIRHESSGDNNVLVEVGARTHDRPQSPFDWRQVQMSDDEGREAEYFRPDTRTVSTSPDPTLEVEDERVCPMCNAVFPRVIPQESFESHVVSHFEVENGFEVIS
ncbi:uncharacterized protein LOC123519334 isoform X3 [Portunus trituberculatus]|uniref:uncharacterized protein LOC123519334 isoform X3 n=1 Tax=Portunus trituberculatus TaxID=210409 RepID=UPI001E1CBA32|nr:uncharacterized protein LOC123519334 isoform X3 [Portunus trituberculatus]